MGNVKVDLSPRLKEWGQGNVKGLNEGMVAAGKRLAPRVEAQVKTRLPNYAYGRTIESKVYPNGLIVVRSTDTRPIKTWLESGKRRGVKLWKGTGAWASGKRLARAQIKAGEYESEIASLLNG